MSRWIDARSASIALDGDWIVDKKQKMVSFTIKELSGVTDPAQPHAKVLIAKGNKDKKKRPGYGKEGPPGIIKQVALTNVVDGHQHTVVLSGTDEYNYGHTSWAGSYVGGDGHDHAWIRLTDGSIEIAESMGHTHTIQTIGKLEDDPMADAATKTEQNDEVAKALQVKLDRMEKVIALSPEHRAHFDTLKGEDADGWLAKSATERDDALREAAEANRIVYKALDGTEYRKQDDPRLVMLAKANDDQAKAIEQMRKDRAEAEITKLAEGLTAYPGDLETRREVVKSMMAIEDKDAREKALKGLQSHNDNLAKSMKELGVTGGPIEKDADDPQARLDELAKQYVKDNPDTSLLKAKVMVQRTPEGAELVRKIHNAAPAVVRTSKGG